LGESDSIAENTGILIPFRKLCEQEEDRRADHRIRWWRGSEGQYGAPKVRVVTGMETKFCHKQLLSQNVG